MNKTLRTEKNDPVRKDTSEEDSRIFAHAEKMMREDKAYRDPKTDLYEMAKQMGVVRNNLSRAINNCSGRNFSMYINSYRVAEAVELLRTRNRYTLSVEAVWRQVGFVSRSPFYHAMKELTGFSASEITAGTKVKIQNKNINNQNPL